MRRCIHLFTSTLATDALLAEGFVLRKDRARAAVKAPESTEHRMKRIVDLNYSDCTDRLLIKIYFRRKKANTLAL